MLETENDERNREHNRCERVKLFEPGALPGGSSASRG